MCAFCSVIHPIRTCFLTLDTPAHSTKRRMITCFLLLDKNINGTKLRAVLIVVLQQCCGPCMYFQKKTNQKEEEKNVPYGAYILYMSDISAQAFFVTTGTK